MTAHTSDGATDADRLIVVVWLQKRTEDTLLEVSLGNSGLSRQDYAAFFFATQIERQVDALKYSHHELLTERFEGHAEQHDYSFLLYL